VIEDGRIIGGEGGRKKYIQGGLEEGPEKGKELSHSAHANGMNVLF